MGSIVPALFLTFSILSLLKKLCEGNGRRADLKEMFALVAWTATSGLIGVGFAAAANAIFPGVMLAMGSPALVGAVIGAIAPLAGFFVTASVEGFIISPVIERFSSKEKEDDPSLCCSL
ncbi:hypothetical protein [Wolbachia endosymbiont of Folsomia candida]|uniref:hypothetical protein n=1 Tax=Wolbachia endosymbiont of Folsomia candida TaxID=169402 RepID=UPI001F400797|nr:hypothetical protein [Wolbachia endosymbiont of Folsomia candida]